MTIIAIPTSRRSIFRVKDLLEIVFVEALFIIGLLSIKGSRPARGRDAVSCDSPNPSLNVHHEPSSS